MNARVNVGSSNSKTSKRYVLGGAIAAALIVAACSSEGDPTREAVLRGSLPSTQACPGAFSTDKSPNDRYGVRTFGCWTSDDGQQVVDPDDAQCTPACFAEARTGLAKCGSSTSGKDCEWNITWFVAGAGGRFQCLDRVRVTNPANGKSVIAIVLDEGPNCVLERRAGKPLFSVSGRVAVALFGSTTVGDDAEVEVTSVPASTSEGPEQK